jgi:hypothetical protein
MHQPIPQAFMLATGSGRDTDKAPSRLVRKDHRMQHWPSYRSAPHVGSRRSQQIAWRIDSLDERLALAADTSSAISVPELHASEALHATSVDVDTGVEFITTATLQGSVFVDSQRNMVRDAGEQGIAHVEVKLVDQLGNIIARQETDAEGDFAFQNVDAGIYDLEVAPIRDYADGGQRAGSSGGDALFEQAIRRIELSPGESAEDYAFTVLAPSVKPNEAMPLPKPILHDSEKPVPTPLSVLALVSASPIVSPVTTSNEIAAAVQVESPVAPLAAATTPIDLPRASGSTLDIPVSGLDAPKAVDAVVVAAVVEQGSAATLTNRQLVATSNQPLSNVASITLSGDFDGDGQEEIATFYRGKWWIDRDADGKPSADDLEIALGRADGLPVIADLNGDGKDELVVVPQSMAKRWLSHVRPKCRIESNVHAFAGDWLGTGRESIGLSTSGEWWLDLNGNRRIDAGDRFGEGTIATDAKPSIGDTNQDGVDELAWETPPQNDAEISSRNADRAFESLYER